MQKAIMLSDMEQKLSQKLILLYHNIGIYVKEKTYKKGRIPNPTLSE